MNILFLFTTNYHKVAFTLSITQQYYIHYFYQIPNLSNKYFHKY